MTMVPHQVDDLRDLPLIERRRRLAKLVGRAKWRAIRFVEHLTGDGPTVFDRLPHGAGGHRVEADGRALSERTVEDVAQVEEPGERGGAPRA